MRLAIPTALVLLGFLTIIPQRVAATSLETLEGVIKEKSGGALGQSRLRFKMQDKSITLRGHTPALQKELGRLNKMTVRIKAYAREGHHEVLSYELLRHKSGEVPRIGRIAGMQVGGEYRILFVSSDGEAALLPSGWVKKMRRHVGAKTWMIGAPRDGQLTPRRFGILRPGPKNATKKSR